MILLIIAEVLLFYQDLAGFKNPRGLSIELIDYRLIFSQLSP